MTRLDDLPTPALVIERSRLERNIARQQARAAEHRVALRPHTKTHKSVAVARRQIAAGAAGITVAKVGEAEVFADAGFEDVRIAYCVVGVEKWRRIARLSRRIRISFCVDTPEGARMASAVLHAEGVEVDVLLEIDTGQGRCGVPWDHPAIETLWAEAAALPGLSLVGILTHAGHAYRGPGEGESALEALQRVADEERDRMLAVAARIAEEGAPPREISVGSTPTASRFVRRDVGALSVTEIRPGNYVYHDLTQVWLGSADMADCALTVLSTVVSKHRDSDGSERCYLDAGKKVLTSDRAPGSDDYGRLLYNARTMTPLPHARLVGLSEEHGWVEVSGGATLEVGDRVRIVPNHACVVANMLEQAVLVDGDDVLEPVTADARARVV